MRPILLDMNDMSDSSEVYESRPHPFFIIFIYLLLVIVVVSILWAAFFKIDIVVKGTGTVSAREDSSIVTNTYAGAVTKCNIVDGQAVKKGDVLYEVEAKDCDLQLNNYNSQLQENENRLAMMEAYLSWLMDSSVDLSKCADNPYYEEYAARQKIVSLQMDQTESDFSTQREAYDAKLASGSTMISYYEEEINKLNQLSVGIRNRVNTFEETDSYYYAKLDNYITQYNNTVSQYDTTLSSLEKELEQAKKELDEANNDISDADNRISQAQKEINDAKTRIAQAQTTRISMDEVALKTAMAENRMVRYKYLVENETQEPKAEEPEQSESSKTSEENTAQEEDTTQTPYTEPDENVSQKTAVKQEEKKSQEPSSVSEDNTTQESASSSEDNTVNDEQNIHVIDTSDDEAVISEKQAEIATAKSEKAAAEAEKKTQEAAIRTKQDSIESTTLQKKNALSKLETETIAGVEASILTYQQNILSEHGTQVETQTAQNNIVEQGIQNSKENVIQTEIQTVSTEISTSKQTKQELEAGLLEVENGKQNTIVKAPISGVVNLAGELVEGNYLSNGTTVMTIIPQEKNSFLVKSFINNQDIAKIQPDMEVKYEVAAYPSSEYGTMTGNVEFVSADLKANSEDGSAYYVVETSIDNAQLYNKTGEKLDLKVGMYCDTKIIVEQKSVLRFLLEKIHLLD